MRTTAFVLGLIGSIIGLIASVVAMFVGAVDEAVTESSSTISGLGISALFASIVAVAGSVVAKFKPKIGGALMVITAIWGTLSISMFYIVSGILLFIGGIVGLLDKSSKDNETEKAV